MTYKPNTVILQFKMSYNTFETFFVIDQLRKLMSHPPNHVLKIKYDVMEHMLLKRTRSPITIIHYMFTIG